MPRTYATDSARPQTEAPPATAAARPDPARWLGDRLRQRGRMVGSSTISPGRTIVRCGWTHAQPVLQRLWCADGGLREWLRPAGLFLAARATARCRDESSVLVRSRRQRLER